MARQTLGARSSGNTTLPLEIRRQGPTAGKYWLGKLDDVRLWTTVQSAAEIASSYRSELTTLPPGLVANWKLDEPSGTVAVDAVAGREAALSVTATFSPDVHP